MTEFTEAYDFRGRTLVDRDGEKIGTLDELYVDQEGGQPEWALVHTGLLGTKKNFVPLRGASPAGEDIQVAVDKQAVKDAPSVDTDQELSRPKSGSCSSTTACRIPARAPPPHRGLLARAATSAAPRTAAGSLSDETCRDRQPTRR